MSFLAAGLQAGGAIGQGMSQGMMQGQQMQTQQHDSEMKDAQLQLQMMMAGKKTGDQAFQHKLQQQKADAETSKAATYKANSEGSLAIRGREADLRGDDIARKAKQFAASQQFKWASLDDNDLIKLQDAESKAEISDSQKAVKYSQEYDKVNEMLRADGLNVKQLTAQQKADLEAHAMKVHNLANNFANTAADHAMRARAHSDELHSRHVKKGIVQPTVAPMAMPMAPPAAAPEEAPAEDGYNSDGTIQVN